MERIRRLARWLGRRERITKRVCFSLIGIALVAFIVIGVAPGGMGGTVGPLFAILAILSVIGAILAMVVWAFCGTLAEVAKPDELESSKHAVITEHVSRLDTAGEAAGLEVLVKAMIDRGIEIPEFADPIEALRAIESARAVREFTTDEANKIWGVACRACAATSQDSVTWRTMEAGAEVVGGRVARLRLAPGVTPPLHLNDEPPRRIKARYRGVDTTIMYQVGWFEQAIGVAALFASIASFIAKGYRGFSGSSGGAKPPVPGWLVTTLVVTALLWIMVFVMKWLRKHRASGWSIVPTPDGFRAESTRFAGRTIDVAAQSCWTLIMPPETANRRGKDPSGWVFFFREEPHTLQCVDFDPRGTPWQSWIEQFYTALNVEHSKHIQATG